MRTLAHYTVYDSEVYNLHTFEFKPDGSVTHFTTPAETAHTRFIEGILIASGPLSEVVRSQIADLLTQNHASPRQLATKLAEIIPAGKTVTHLYQVTYPYKRMEIVTIRYVL